MNIRLIAAAAALALSATISAASAATPPQQFASSAHCQQVLSDNAQQGSSEYKYCQGDS